MHFVLNIFHSAIMSNNKQLKDSLIPQGLLLYPYLPDDCAQQIQIRQQDFPTINFTKTVQQPKIATCLFQIFFFFLQLFHNNNFPLSQRRDGRIEFVHVCVCFSGSFFFVCAFKHNNTIKVYVFRSRTQKEQTRRTKKLK